MMPSAWRLVRDSFRDFKQHWTTYSLIVAIIAIPGNLLTLIPGLAENSNVDVYYTLAAIFMSVALLFAIHQFATGSKSVPLSDAYYNGSGFFLSFLIVLFWWSLMALPLVAATFIYLIGTYPQGGVEIPLNEQLIIGGICLAIATVSFWLFTRFSLALPLVVQGNRRPFSALGHARNLTLGRFWRVFLRLFALVVMTALILVALYAPIFGLSLLVPGLAPALYALYQILIALIILPFLNLYLYKLAHALAEVTP